MSLDIERLRAKLDSLKNPKKGGGNKTDRKTWSPDTKKSNTIRLVQYPYTDDPFVELYFHYGIGKSGILCSRQNEGKTCPICEFGYELYKGGDKETSKKMFAKQRVYAAVIDRSEPNPIPRLWGFGKEIYQQLIESLLSEDYGSFLDPVNGLDAELKCEKAADAQWAKPKLTFKRKESRLAATDKQIQEILSAVPKVEDVFKPLTVNEINARLAAWLQMTEKDGSETVKGGNGASAAAAETTDGDEGESDNIKDLDAAFEQALKDE